MKGIGYSAKRRNSGMKGYNRCAKIFSKSLGMAFAGGGSSPKSYASNRWCMVVICIIVAISIFSCKSNVNNNQSVRDKFVKDSIELVKKEAIRIDSIARKIKIDSIIIADGYKAIGNIKFGISKKEFNRQTNIFGNMLVENKIGNTTITGRIDGSFTATDSLYEVVLYESGRYTLDEASDINNTTGFVDFLNLKYGNSKNNQKEIWEVGNRIFIRQAFDLEPDIKIEVNPKGIEGNKIRPKYKKTPIIRCGISLIIRNADLYMKEIQRKKMEEEKKALDTKNTKELNDKKNAEILKKL